MHQTTRDDLIRNGLAICRSAGDFDSILLTVRTFRYWALRLELADPGPVDDELALITEPDIIALRCAIRQGWQILRAPLGDWRRKGEALLAEVDNRPVLAYLAAQARSVLASPVRASRRPRELISRWSPQESRSPVLHRELHGHKGAVTACDMPSRSTVLVTVDDTEVLVWDLRSGALRAIHGDGESAETLAACAPRSAAWVGTVQIPGGRLGRSVGRSAALKIWDLRNDGPPRTLVDVRDGPYTCQLSPDERWLVSVHSDNKAYVWDTGTWELAGVLNEQSNPVSLGNWAARYAADGSWFALANEDGSIGLWDPATHTLRHLLAGHGSSARELAAPWDSSWLASTDGDELCIWDTRRGALIRSLGASGAGCAGLVAEPAGGWVAACFGTDSLRIVPVTGRQQRGGAVGRAARRIGHIRRSAGLLAGSWEFTGARCQTGRDGSRIFSMSAVEATSRNGQMISSRYLVSCWDPATGQRIAGPTSRPGELPQAIMDRDQQWAAVVAEDRVEIFEPETAEVLSQFSYTPDRVRTAAAGPTMLAAGFESGTVRVFRPGASGRMTSTQERAPSGLTGCFAAPHGGWMIAWVRRDVAVLDRHTGAVRSWLQGDNTGVFLNKRINACSFAPDGSWVATADDNGTVRVWNPDTGQQRALSRGQDGEDFVPGPCASARWMATLDMRGGRLHIRDALGATRHELHHASQPRRACADGDSWLAVEDETGIRLWNPIAGTHLGDLPGEYGAAPLPLGRTSTHALIATMGATGDIRIRDPFTSRLHTALAGSAGTDAQRDGSRVRAVHPGGDWLVVSDDHGSLTAWLTADGERKQLSQAYGEFVTACSVTRDGSMLAITRKSGVLHVWESATWQQIATMRADGPLTDCCWSPFGEHIYAVGERGAYCFDAP